MTRKMLPPRRVKIVESKYVEQSDLIQWKLLFLDNGMEQVYVWPSADLLKALNITAKVDSLHLLKFCDNMTNKEINFVIDEEPELPSPEITKDEFDSLGSHLCEHFDTFKKVVEEDK